MTSFEKISNRFSNKNRIYDIPHLNFEYRSVTNSAVQNIEEKIKHIEKDIENQQVRAKKVSDDRELLNEAMFSRVLTQAENERLENSFSEIEKITNRIDHLKQILKHHHDKLKEFGV